MTAATKPSLGRWMWLAAALLMLGEFLLFDRMTSRNHASVYPRWNDQIQYLTESYYAYDHMQAHGLPAGVKFALTTDAVQGKLHNTAAVLVFWVAGSASRSAALSLNMLVFLAWQAALLFTIVRVSGSRPLAWMGSGLVLCLAWPWSVEAGTAVDFRLDHAAMCLFGITACAALLTDGFRSTRWSLAFGAIAGVTLLERFLSGAYFAPIFVLTALWLLGRESRWLRLRNLVLAGGVMAVLALPFFWLNRAGIYDYYWAGHVTNAEGAARLRGYDLGQSAWFVLGRFGALHLGAWFGATVAALTGLLLLLFARHPRKPAEDLAPDWLFFGGVFLLVPAMILTVHPQKSEVVLGILAPGTILLVLWGWRALWHRIEFGASRPWSRLLPAVPAVAALAAGVGYFTYRELQPPYHPQFLESARKINEVSDYIFNSVRTRNLAHPDVGIDRVVDYLDGRILRLTCYERHKTWIDFGLHLPDSILAGKDETIMFKLRHTDFMILTDRGSSHWPYEKQMERLYPVLKDWCNENMVMVESFSAFGRDMSLYRRANFPSP